MVAKYKKRKIFGRMIEVNQNGYLNATEFIKKEFKGSSLTFNPTEWLKTLPAKRFILMLKKKYRNQHIVITTLGYRARTWIHPQLFLKLAAHIDSGYQFEINKAYLDAEESNNV